MQHIHRNWNLIFWAAVIVALGCIGPAQRSAWAQNSVAGWPEKNYTVLKPQAARFETRNSVAKSLRTGTFDPGDEQVFAAYYKQSVFPSVTHLANRESPRDDVIAKLRSDLKQAAGEKPREGEPPKDQQVFDKLADLILTAMTEIANDGQYHPAVRVNAMLAIGEVNSPKAAKVLVDTAFGKGQVFAIRVAAMAGLVRMAGPSGKQMPGGTKVLSSDPAIESLVMTNMVKCVQAKKKDDGVSWMRGQAADVLGDLGKAGSKGEVQTALLIMLNDKALPIPLRSKAARALGKLDYSDNQPAAGPSLKALAEFASEALSSDQPDDRGRVRLVARDVLEGLKPFASSTLSNDQILIDGLQKTLQQLNKDTADKMNDTERKTAIAKAKESLDGILKK